MPTLRFLPCLTLLWLPLLCLVVGCSRSVPGTPATPITVEATGGAPTGPAETWQVAAPAAATPFPADAEHGWPGWRGPNRDGTAPGADPPLEWSATQNVLWKTPVPGRGHASPCVSGGMVFLATAETEGEVQSVIAFDAARGTERWRREISRGGFPPFSQMHGKSTHATATPCCDGERVFAMFLHDGAVWAAAITTDGEPAWADEVEVGPFTPKFGYAPSPTLYKDFLIVAGDHEAGGWVAALDRKTGAVRWRVPRPAATTYSSPLVAQVAGRDQLFLPGADQLASLDPATGQPLWKAAGLTTATAATAIYGSDFVIATAGFPGRETLCVRADGTAAVLWKNGTKGYVPSALLWEGNVYVISDEGIAHCFDAATGHEHWKGRLPGGEISASPVVAAGHLFVTNEHGVTFVLRATPDEFDLVRENRLGDETFASPAVVADRLYLRTATGLGPNRKETLWCLGRKTTDAAL